MSKLGYVWFWPDAGHRGEPWAESAAEDAFLRTSRRVTERYSEALDGLGLQALRWSQKISVSSAGEFSEKLSSRVVVDLHHLPRREHVARAYVPPEVVEMTPQSRARLVLEVVDAAVQCIGARRGWPAPALEHVLQHALDHDLEFEMKGPWTLNPTHDRRIRPVARIADDGWSDLSFEVADEASGDSLGFTRVVRSPANALSKFQDTVKELRWADPTTVERRDGWTVQSGTTWGDFESFDIEELRPWPLTIGPVPPQSPLTVEIRETVHGRP
jgi:hypothetical protein